MSEDIDELLYTQEDINEWMRACDELQEVLLDKREEIKNIQSQLDQQKAMWNELKEWLVDKMKYYNNCLNKNTLISSERQKILCTKSNQCFEIITQMEYIEKELEGEDE